MRNPSLKTDHMKQEVSIVYVGKYKINDDSNYLVSKGEEENMKPTNSDIDDDARNKEEKTSFVSKKLIIPISVVDKELEGEHGEDKALESITVGLNAATSTRQDDIAVAKETEDIIDAETKLQTTPFVLKRTKKGEKVITPISLTDTNVNDTGVEENFRNKHNDYLIERTDNRKGEYILIPGHAIDKSPESIGDVGHKFHLTPILKVTLPKSDREKVILPKSVICAISQKDDTAMGSRGIDDHIPEGKAGTKEEEDKHLISSSVVDNKTEYEADKENVLETTSVMNVTYPKGDVEKVIISISDNAIKLDEANNTAESTIKSNDTLPEETDATKLLLSASFIDKKPDVIGGTTDILELTSVLNMAQSKIDDEKFVISTCLTRTEGGGGNMALKSTRNIHDYMGLEGTTEEGYILIPPCVIDSKPDGIGDVEKIEETEIAVPIERKIEDIILQVIEGTKKKEEKCLLASSVMQTGREDKLDAENDLESTLDLNMVNLKSDEDNFIIPTCIARTDVEEDDTATESTIVIGKHRPESMEGTAEEEEVNLIRACVIDSKTEELGLVENILESAPILEIKPSQSEDKKVIIPISVTGTKVEETEIAVSVGSKIEDIILQVIKGTKKEEEEFLLASTVIQTGTEEKVDVENVLESTLDMSIGNLKSDEDYVIIPTCIARTDVEENDMVLERRIEIGDHRPGGMEETPEENEISLKSACVIDSKTEEIGVVEKLLESAHILEIKPSQSEDEKVIIPISVTGTKIEESEIAVSIVSKIEDNIILEIEDTKKEEEEFLLASSVIQTGTEEKVDVENVLESTLDMSIGNLKSDEDYVIIPTCIARIDIEENDIALERRIEIGDHHPGGMEETPEENEISLKSACVIDSKTEEIGVVEKLLESALILEIKPSQSEDEKVIIPISVTGTKIEETEIAVSIVSKIEDNIILEIEDTKKEEEEFLLASSVIQTGTEEKVDVENVLESTLDMSIGNLKSDEDYVIIPTCIARIDIEENDIALERRIEIGDHHPGGMEETQEENEISLKSACVIDSKTEEIGVVEKLLESALILEIKPSQSEDEKVIIINEHCILFVYTRTLYIICLYTNIVYYLFINKHCILFVYKRTLYIICLYTNTVYYLFINEHCILFVYNTNTVYYLFINEHCILFVYTRTLYIICLYTNIVYYLFINKHCILFVYKRTLYIICLYEHCILFVYKRTLYIICL